MDWKIKLFVALGGVGMVLGAIAKGIKPAVKKAVLWGISKDHPAVRQFVLDNRVWIEAQFDAADQALKEAIEEEAAAPVAPPDPPK